MGKTVVTARIDGGLLEWVDGFAAKRGVPRTAVLDEALREFRVAREGGVPELSPSRDLAVVQDEANVVREARLATMPGQRSRVTPEEVAERMRERDRLLAEARASVVRRGS